MANLPPANLDALKQHCGTAMRWLRAERGLTQAELAVLTGLHRSYIADVERGVRHVSLMSVARSQPGLARRYQHSSPVWS